MKTKNLSMIGLMIWAAFLLSACGESATTITTNNSAAPTKSETAKVDDSKWTTKDKENAVNNCKFGRKTADPAKVETLCACYLNKVIALSPNPMEQSKIPMAEAVKLNADCAKEAGL